MSECNKSLNSNVSNQSFLFYVTFNPLSLLLLNDISPKISFSYEKNKKQWKSSSFIAGLEIFLFNISFIFTLLFDFVSQKLF